MLAPILLPDRAPQNSVIVLDTSQGRPISRKNFAYDRNATMPVGLDDRGIAGVDLGAERCLDVRKVRDQHRVGASLWHRGDHLLHLLDPLWPWRRHWRVRDWNKRLDQQRIGCLDSSERLHKTESPAAPGAGIMSE
jgi:hypothetical protein